MSCLERYECPVEATVSLIGGKYKPQILWHLKDGTARFGELQSRISKATSKMLTQQLRQLERDGFVKRKVYPVVPPKVEYSLTDFGKTILPIMIAMCDWGQGYLEKQSRKKRTPSSRVRTK